MARGADEKNSVINKILETFDGSFLYNNGKEIRVPINDVQIKITLACAKENVTAGEDTMLPGAKEKESNKEVETISFKETKAEQLKPTEEEKKNVEQLLKTLGML